MKKQLQLLLLINSFFIFAINLFAPLYALYIQKIEASAFHIGGIWAFYLFSVAILTFLLSKFENKKRYADYFLIFGFIFRAAGWAMYIFANSLIQLYLIQILLAIGESFGTPSFDLIYSSFLTRGHYASDWGDDISLNALITAIASLSGGIIVYKFGFPILFCLMIILSFISTLTALRFRKIFS